MRFFSSINSVSVPLILCFYALLTPDRSALAFLVACSSLAFFLIGVLGIFMFDTDKIRTAPLWRTYSIFLVQAAALGLCGFMEWGLVAMLVFLALISTGYLCWDAFGERYQRVSA